MNDYKVGTIFDIHDNDSKKYMIINNYEKANNIYLLASPVEDVNGTWKIRYGETFLLSVDKSTQKLEFEADSEIVTEVLNDFMDKSGIKYTD